jgi:hypothetical protein
MLLKYDASTVFMITNYEHFLIHGKSHMPFCRGKSVSWLQSKRMHCQQALTVQAQTRKEGKESLFSYEKKAVAWVTQEERREKS